MRRRWYRDSLEHNQQLIASVGLSRKQKKERSKDFGFALDQFLEKVRDGPDFVCCVCRRLFFRNQVLSCDRKIYSASIETNSFTGFSNLIKRKKINLQNQLTVRSMSKKEEKKF